MSLKKKTSQTNKKSYIFPIVAWALFAGAAVWFTIVFRSFDMFPDTWLLILITVLALLGLLTGWVVYSRKVGKSSKTLAGILNILLSVLLVAGSIFLPYVRSSVEKIFMNLKDAHVLSVNFYVVSDAYKEAHPEIFRVQEQETTGEEQGEGTENAEQSESGQETPANEINPEDYPEEVRELLGHRDSTFLIQDGLDLDNQSFALNQLKELYETDSLNTKDYASLWDAYDALLANEGEVFVMNSLYEEILSDVSGYKDFQKNTRVIYTFTKIIEKPDIPEPDVSGDSFSILLAGVDTYGGISTYGRTDVVMIATVNTKTHQASLVSFPRDSYMGNPAFGYRKDKLTHMGVSGMGNTMAALENYTGVKIDYYAVTNFTAFVNIIDALGGVDIYNPYSFSTNNARNTWAGTFYEGNIHLDGTMALAYCRERYNLPNGDFGRAEHENIVMRAVMHKLLSPAILTNFTSLMSRMSGMVATNFPTEDMFSMVKEQLDSMSSWNIVSKSLKGSTGGASCAAAGGEVLSVVFLYDDHVNAAIDLMNKVINGETIE